jgi:hypothetical protein
MFTTSHRLRGVGLTRPGTVATVHISVRQRLTRDMGASMTNLSRGDGSPAGSEPAPEPAVDPLPGAGSLNALAVRQEAPGVGAGTTLVGAAPAVTAGTGLLVGSAAPPVAPAAGEGGPAGAGDTAGRTAAVPNTVAARVVQLLEESGDAGVSASTLPAEFQKRFGVKLKLPGKLGAAVAKLPGVVPLGKGTELRFTLAAGRKAPGVGAGTSVVPAAPAATAGAGVLVGRAAPSVAPTTRAGGPAGSTAAVPDAVASQVVQLLRESGDAGVLASVLPAEFKKRFGVELKLPGKLGAAVAKLPGVAQFGAGNTMRFKLA